MKIYNGFNILDKQKEKIFQDLTLMIYQYCKLLKRDKEDFYTELYDYIYSLKLK